MANVPENLRYSREHEWVRVEGDTAVIGITDFAQKELGEMVFVELPELGQTFAAGDSFGSVESVKAVSDLYTLVSGQVTEVNDAVVDNPELVNADAFGAGWLIKLTMSDPGQVDGLMTAAQYLSWID